MRHSALGTLSRLRHGLTTARRKQRRQHAPRSRKLTSTPNWRSAGRKYVRRRLPILSTYLGHVHVTDTYWYLSNTPELMAAAGDCIEKRWEEQR